MPREMLTADYDDAAEDDASNPLRSPAVRMPARTPTPDRHAHPALTIRAPAPTLAHWRQQSHELGLTLQQLVTRAVTEYLTDRATETGQSTSANACDHPRPPRPRPRASSPSR